MNAIIILFLVGIICLVVEVIAPGAVLGVLGGTAMVGGCIVAFTRFGFTGGLLASGVAVVLLAVALYLEFYLLPRTKVGKQMFVTTSVDSTSQAPVGTDSLIGKTAEAVTTLAPSGYVVIDGHRYEAFCSSGLAAKGSSLKVTAHDNFRIIVTKIA